MWWTDLARTAHDADKEGEGSRRWERPSRVILPERRGPMWDLGEVMEAERCVGHSLIALCNLTDGGHGSLLAASGRCLDIFL